MPTHHILLLIVVNLAWGFNFVAGKIGTEHFSPMLFSALRFGFVLILLAPFLRIVPGQMRNIAVLGVILGAGHYTVMFYAIHIGEVLSSIAIASQLVVPLSTLLAVMFLGERIRWVRTLAIAMCFLGVVIIGFEPVGANDVFAISLAALGALAMAFATIIMRRLQGVGVFNLQAWIALVSTLCLSAISFAIEDNLWQQLKQNSLTNYWAPLYSAAGATIFGHGTLYWLLQRYAVNLVTPFITLSTIFAVCFGILIFDDALTLRIIVGGLLTLCGVYIISRRLAPLGNKHLLGFPHFQYWHTRYRAVRIFLCSRIYDVVRTFHPSLTRYRKALSPPLAGHSYARVTDQQRDECQT